MMGAPGSGKGTQAAAISALLNIPAISSGGMLREAIAKQTEVGMQAKSYMDKGEYVPDEVMCELVINRLNQSDCANGYILDGFPRTAQQAEVLKDNGIVIDHVLLIDVSDDSIVRRLGGRRVCSLCDTAYHVVHNPTKVEDKCDKCSGELTIRSDDQPETIKSRLLIYHELTAPLIAYYNDKLIKVDGTLPVAEITEQLSKSLSK